MLKKSKLLVILLILLFPSVLYLVLTTGKHHFISLPYYGPKNSAAPGDTSYHRISEFELTNCNYDSLEGKITIVHFFNSRCNDVCAKVAANLVNLQERLQEKSVFKILSINTNANVSVSELSTFANSFHANPKTWTISSGDSVKIQQLAQTDFLLNVEIGYSETLTLLDKELHIRGFYDGSVLKEVNKMHDDMKMLMAEYMLAKKDKKVNR